MSTERRVVSWIVILLGCITTIATSRAPGMLMTTRFDRELGAGESAHVTFQITERAMDHVRANSGWIELRMQSEPSPSGSVVPDASTEVTLFGVGSTTLSDGVCPAAGACEIGVTLLAPAASETSLSVFLDLHLGQDRPFPDGVHVVAVED